MLNNVILNNIELQKEIQFSIIKYAMRLNKINTQQKEVNSSKFTVSKKTRA